MKSVLIISPYFAPENAVASIRFTKIAKYLKRMGYKVTVICAKNMCTDMEDVILKNDCSSIDCVYRLSPISFNKWVKGIYAKIEKRTSNVSKSNSVKKTEKSGKSVFQTITNSRPYQAFLEAWIYWMEILLGRKMIKFVKTVDMREFDCVISTYGPLSSLMLGNYIKRKKLCKKWIADFRDVVYDVMGKETKIRYKRKKMIAKMCVRADAVTAITPEMLATLNSYVHRFEKGGLKNPVCISNGFDPEDREYLVEKGERNTLEFAYCGIIYNEGEKLLRNPTPMFRAVRELADEGKVDPDKIRFHYAGKNADAFLKIASAHNLEDYVVNHGFVERNDSLNIQRAADIVLSLSWNTKNDKGIMTGKIYEALLIERPILCLISGDAPGSRLGDIITTSGVGFVWEEGAGADIDSIKDWILECYREKMETGEITYACEESEIVKYSYPYLTKKITGIL